MVTLRWIPYRRRLSAKSRRELDQIGQALAGAVIPPAFSIEEAGVTLWSYAANASLYIQDDPKAADAIVTGYAAALLEEFHCDPGCVLGATHALRERRFAPNVGDIGELEARILIEAARFLIGSGALDDADAARRLAASMKLRAAELAVRCLGFAPEVSNPLEDLLVGTIRTDWLREQLGDGADNT